MGSVTANHLAGQLLPPHDPAGHRALRRLPRALLRRQVVHEHTPALQSAHVRVLAH